MCHNEQACAEISAKRVCANNGGYACTFPDTSQRSVVRDRIRRTVGLALHTALPATACHAYTAFSSVLLEILTPSKLLI